MRIFLELCPAAACKKPTRPELCPPSTPSLVDADSVECNSIKINFLTIIIKINIAGFTKLYCSPFFLPLSLFSPHSVQTATHTAAQSEWGSYADHFFHLSSPTLPLPLLRIWKVCLSSVRLSEMGSVTSTAT